MSAYCNLFSLILIGSNAIMPLSNFSDLHTVLYTHTSFTNITDSLC